MKIFKVSLILLFTVSTTSSCVSSRRVSINTIRPADIHLDEAVHTLLLVDRTEPSKKALGVIEGILTGEAPYEDKAAVQQLISTLRNEIQVSPRFDVNSSPKRLKGNSLSSAFPPQLGWNEINSLCNRFGGEAVISVEIFDTDFIVTEEKRRVKKTVGSGDDRREVEVDEFFAEGVGNIKIGIRLYDKLNQRIIDEQLLNETNTWQSAANSKAQAIAQLINKSKATQELAKRVASNYAYKVAPMPVRLTRSYYKKSKKAPALNRGTRLADVNQWEEAIQAWQAGISTADEKRAGYLAYNIAVGYEVLGDFDTAISWAQKAYTDYGNKRARGYVNTLENRKFEEQRVRDQMGNGN